MCTPAVCVCTDAGCPLSPTSPSQDQVPPPPPPKPAALTCLGVGGAAQAGRRAAAAAALAALTAAAVPPRQLASEVRGRAVTVTAATAGGARVYCQLVATGAGAGDASAGGAGGGGTNSSSRLLRDVGVGGVGGLLQQPIDDLLEMLAARRRQVRGWQGARGGEGGGSEGVRGRDRRGVGAEIHADAGAEVGGGR